jgi:hypothetical protein
MFNNRPAVFVITFLLSFMLVLTSDEINTSSLIDHYFLDSFLSSSNLTQFIDRNDSADSLREILNHLQTNFVESRNYKCILERNGIFNESLIKFTRTSNTNPTSFINDFNHKCVSSDSLLDLFNSLNLNQNRKYQKNDLKNFLFILFNQYTNDGCNFCHNKPENFFNTKKITSKESIIFKLSFYFLTK